MKRREADDPGDHRQPDHRVAPASRRLLDQGEGRATEADRREQDSEPVDAEEGVLVAALLDGVEGERHRGRDQRDVDPEDRPPRDEADQSTASGRAEHGRDPRPRRPGADRATAGLAREGRRDDRQRAGDQERPGDPLQGAGADQELRAGGDRAERRGRAEGDQPGDEYPAAAELVAEAAADQEQGDQGQGVGLDDPLLAGEADVEPVADRRQRHVDDGPVEEDDGGAQDRRYQRQTLLAGHAPESTRAAASSRQRPGDLWPRPVRIPDEMRDRNRIGA